MSQADAQHALEERLGHSFKDPTLLRAALTHPSASARNRTAATRYEQLEFLGDRVLGLVMADWLLETHPESSEGELARRHAAAVKRDTLHAVAKKIALLPAMRLSKSELQNERGQANVLADALEATIAALYLDGGLRVAQKFIRMHFAEALQGGSKGTRDPKTALQEWAQARKLPVPTYVVESKSGPAHDPVFVVKVTVGKEKPVTAEGASKQVAEKKAAQALLDHLQDKDA